MKYTIEIDLQNKHLCKALQEIQKWAESNGDDNIPASYKANFIVDGKKKVGSFRFSKSDAFKLTPEDEQYLKDIDKVFSN